MPNHYLYSGNSCRNLVHLTNIRKMHNSFNVSDLHHPDQKRLSTMGNTMFMMHLTSPTSPTGDKTLHHHQH